MTKQEMGERIRQLDNRVNAVRNAVMVALDTQEVLIERIGTLA